MAGTALLITNHLKRHINSECFTVRKPHLTGSYNYYNVTPFSRFRKCLYNAIIQSKHFDIIHIHSVDYVVPIFKLLGKKVVLHYHGSDIMDQGNSKLKKFCRGLADYIIYNAEIMESKLPGKNKQYLPDFIDTDLFKPSGNGKGSVIIVSSNLDIAKSIKNIDSDTNVYNFDGGNRIEYTDMPNFLNKYTKYFDDKVTDYGMTCTEFSNTGLQALSCGLDVIHQGKTFKVLPKNRTSEYYIMQLLKIYYGIL